MDPNANLNRQKMLAARIQEDPCDLNQATELAELVTALDEWIRGGGFLPEAWQPNAKQAVPR